MCVCVCVYANVCVCMYTNNRLMLIKLGYCNWIIYQKLSACQSKRHLHVNLC